MNHAILVAIPSLAASIIVNAFSDPIKVLVIVSIIDNIGIRTHQLPNAAIRYNGLVSTFDPLPIMIEYIRYTGTVIRNRNTYDTHAIVPMYELSACTKFNIPNIKKSHKK
jgi:hypothetical protein